MNALTILERDHQEVERLFRQYEALGDRAKARKRLLVEKIGRLLAAHDAIEEQVFYPAARRHPELASAVLAFLEAHEAVKWVLLELLHLPEGHERAEGKVRVLMTLIRAHVKEEERAFFPQVRKVIRAEELDRLGEAMGRAKLFAPTRPHPLAPDTPPANVVAGLVSAVVDRGRDAVRGIRRRGRAIAARTARRGRA